MTPLEIQCSDLLAALSNVRATDRLDFIRDARPLVEAHMKRAFELGAQAGKSAPKQGSLL